MQQHVRAVRIIQSGPPRRLRGYEDREMAERYRDFYGCTASITHKADGTYRLITRTPSGRKIRDQIYKTHRGAARAMQNDSDSTMELIKKET